jgi:RsiW-degrading membrane proteinase PrsW (M82 family)
VGVVSDLRDDVVGFVRDPSDEQKAILVAIVAIAVADRYLLWQEFPFVVRTTAAVGVGFIALFAASYLLTGRLVPPDDDTDEE